MSCSTSGRNKRKFRRNRHGKMTVSLFIKQFKLPCFSSYCIIKMKEIKFFPREKDRKPEEVNAPVEETKDVEKDSKNDNN